MRIAERMIVAPVVTGELSGYIPILCDQRRLAPHQGEALRRLFQGLQQTGARLANGKVIAHRSDVFPWVLDQLAADVPEVGKVTLDRLDAIETGLESALEAIREIRRAAV